MSDTLFGSDNSAGRRRAMLRTAMGPTIAAALADLLDRPRAVVDHRFEIAVRGGVAEADQHGDSFENAFQFHFRQAEKYLAPHPK